jgi:hypothetical protein
MNRFFIALVGMLLISGCQATDPLSSKGDPHSPWWNLDFQGPSYMLGWVENSTVEDVDGRIVNNHFGGTLGTDTPEDGTEAAKGWHRKGGDSIKLVTGAALPKRIFVRWQSIVEPKTYKVLVDISEEARQALKASIARRCPETPNKRAPYAASMTLGLAPGGVVQVWVKDSCFKPINVGRAQAEVEPLGPSQGKTEGRYAYKLNDKTQRYIERFGIPYGSW